MKPYEYLNKRKVMLRTPKEKFGGSARNVGYAYKKIIRRQVRTFLKNQLKYEIHETNE